MKLNNIVFVPSVQHTGTWFTIKFLQHFFTQRVELTSKYELPISKRTVAHIHFPIIQQDAGFDIMGGKLYKEWKSSFETIQSISISTILLFCNFFKTVIPVRDPMAAILSREARHPEFRHFYIIDNFISLATEFVNHPNIMFLPIDSVETAAEREILLEKVLEHVGVDVEPNKESLKSIAEAWLPENITPNNRFKRVYEENDVEAAKNMLGQKWAEVEYLKNMAGVIMPFLANLGYKREQLRLW